MARLPFRGRDYPRREPFFAVRFARLLAKTCAANEIGADGCWLLCLVAQIEDARRYSSAPTFYNEQLAPLMGLEQRQFRRVRDRCVAAGWLHYEPGGKGRAGVYWVVWPEHLREIDDTPPGGAVPVQAAAEHCTGIVVADDRESSGETAFPVVSDHQSSGNTTTNRPGTRPPSLPEPRPGPPPPRAPHDRSVEAEAVRILQTTGVGRPVEVARAALEAGASLDVLGDVVAHFEAHPGWWGPGALVARLVTPSVAVLDPAEGWPTPNREAVRQSAAREREGRQSEAEAAERDQRAAERSRMEQLELEFGEAIDAEPVESLRAIASERNSFLANWLRGEGWREKVRDRNGPVRGVLLEAFAERRAG